MNIKQTLLNTLAEADGGYISGAAIAEKLGVSRNAVWKTVKALEADGFVIESVTSKGYRLSADSNRISADLIAPLLTTKEIGRNMQVFSEIGSTNTAAKKLASEKVPNGTVIIADKQTEGRGRMGRSFESPSGTGIYMSLVLYPKFGLECAPLITSAAACAVAEAIDEVCGCDVSIKWVNDLYLNGRKICGILTEASLGLEMKNLDHAVIGIGVNVRSVRNVFGEELGNIATSIEDETGVKADRNVLCGAMLNKLEHYLGMVESREFLNEYRRRELLTGNTITANVGGNTLTGMAMGIDDNANLIIKLPDGKLKKLSSGEASLCRVKQ
ncbi:MAG TPA: biotin--[acetyl-CoA-carboxylase] ligase [Ruminococcus flavefaciens]|nr:biotin--[acetyl-CoA-carboxylase] ligase [Ruminococcus flavefaciens]HQM00354.1 biotin--[acetyl-CoA-carboxylase] ligase [Ruminococcus flavefaciens]